MKRISTLFSAIAVLFTVQTSAQYTQNFESASSLTSGCVTSSNTYISNSAPDVITGSGSLYSNPPVTGSGTRDFATPYLNITSTSFTVSFNYKLNETLNGQAVRTIQIGLEDQNGFTPLHTITMDNNNDPVVATSFSQTFTVATGVKRLAIKMGGGFGNGSVRIIMDDLIVSANANYSIGGTCNMAPSIQNDFYTSPLIGAYSGASVLTNDSDPNGEVLSAPSIVTTSPDGTVVLNADGTFTFTPNAVFTGPSTSFTYRVYDNGFEPASGTATVIIYFPSGATLPVKMINFQGYLVNNKAQLKWSVDDNEAGSRFEIEKSEDGRTYSLGSVVFNSNKTGTEKYIYNDNTTLTNGTYYRIKTINRNNSIAYTRVIFLKGSSELKSAGLVMLQNPIQSDLAFNYTSLIDGQANINLYDVSGIRVQSFQSMIHKGTNAIVYPINSRVVPGTYILELVTASERKAIKIIK